MRVHLQLFFFGIFLISLSGGENMRIIKQDKQNGELTEISESKAIALISIAYNNPQEVLKSSSYENKINLIFSCIWVSEPIGSINAVTGTNKPTDDIHKVMTSNKQQPKLRLRGD